MKFKHGERFPKRFNDKISDGMLLLASESFAQRVLDFQRVDLPIFSKDVAKLHGMMMKYTPNQISSARNVQQRQEKTRPRKVSAEYPAEFQTYIRVRLTTLLYPTVHARVPSLRQARLSFEALERIYLRHLQCAVGKQTTSGLYLQAKNIDRELIELGNCINSSTTDSQTTLKKINLKLRTLSEFRTSGSGFFYE